MTLTATDRGDVVGTVTIGIDSERGLMADELFKDILDEHRARGARLCECTKLAFDLSERSRVPLANVFHLALIYARDLYDCTDVVIEINPRHRRFYERMLGFRQQGELKINPRVNAPAYLMHLTLEYVSEQVERFGGTFDTAAGSAERSLYPYFFSPREERGIINRLLRMDEQNTSR
ncbi:MAG: N-acetyltransferase [Pseudomonadota bacterium]